MANTIGLQAIVDVTQFNQGLRLYIKGMLDMSQATSQASTQINRLGVAASAGLGAALGTAAVGAVTSLASTLAGLARQVGENISTFQGLALSLNFFAAQALQQVSPEIPLARALEETSEQAQGLLLWVEQLATLSPFTAEQVGNTFRTAQAYGLSLAAAQKLVPLMVDFASVNNLSAELLQRVSLAIAQIQARGKLAAQEINQLANAGFPLRQILAKNLGVTSGELEKMLEDGLIPASVAIQAVTERLESFGGAAERVTRGTLRGILSSLEDIRDISSRDFFGPMVSAFFPLLNQLIDVGSSPQFKAGMKVIGQELGEGLAARIRLGISQVILMVDALKQIPAPVLQATAIFAGFTVTLIAFTGVVGLLAAALVVLINPFTVIIAAIAGFVTAYSTNFRGIRDITTNTATAVSQALSSMARAITSTLSSAVTVIGNATRSIGELANTVVDYGSAVVESFAAGITGSLGLLVDGMRMIGQVLSFWLQPGSPPRVAPDLDKWGTGAANSWLRGWLTADFDILSNISKDIGSVLGALVGTGQLDELAAPRILRALRTELAGAVGEFRRFGNVSEATLNRVARSAGPAANQVRQLFVNYVALTAETNAVSEAQRKLVDITERYDAALEPLRKKLSDISALRQQADEQKEILSLTRLINNTGVSAARKQGAQLRIQEIMMERQVRGLEGRQSAEESAAEAELKAAEKRRTVAEENLNRVKAMIDVQNEHLSLYAEELQILEKIRKEQERLAKEARQKMLEQLKRQLEIAQLLQAELRDTIAIFKAQYTLADASATAAEKAAAALELQAVAGRRIVRDFEAAELGIDPSQIQAIRDTLVTLSDIGVKLESPLGDYEFAVESSLEDTQKLVTEMNAAMQDIREMFSKTRAEVDGFFVSINDMLPGFLKFRKETNSSDSSLSDHLRTVRAQTDEFKEWPPLFRTLATAFSGIASGLVTSRILTTLPQLLAGLGGPVGIVTALVSVFAATWAGNWFDIREKAESAINYVEGLIDGFLNSDKWEQYAQDVNAQVASVQHSLQAFAAQATDTFMYVLRPILAQGLSLKSIEQSISRLRSLLVDGLRSISGDVSDEAKGLAGQITGQMQAFLESQWTPFIAILLLNARNIVNVFSTLFKEIVEQFAFLPRLIGFTMRTVVTLFGIGLKGLAPIIGRVLASINGSILAQLGNLGHLLAAAIVSPIRLIGNLLNLNNVITAIVQQFTTGFAAQITRNSPRMWAGLITGLVKLDALIGNTIVRIFSAALATVRSLGRGYLGVFRLLDTLTFEGFRLFVQAGFDIPKIFVRLGQSIQSFGVIALSVFRFVSDAILSLVTIDYKPFYDFFNRIKPTATATFPLLNELFDLTRAGLVRLTTAFAPAYAAFKANILPIFTGGTGTSAGFLNNIQKIGTAIGGKFVTVFQQFKGVGPTVAAAFKGLGQGLSQLSLTGSIKVLEFFDSLSKGILTFAGKGQTKLGGALAGIFQGAFKGITTGITSAPNFVGNFLKSLNLASIGQAAKIKGPVVLQQFFSTLAQFKPANIVRGLGSIFKSLKSVAGAFGGFLNPINLVLGALDFFGFAFRNNIDGVENRAVSFIDGLKRAWDDLISGELWQRIAANMGRAFAFITEVWQEFQANGINSPRIREMLTLVGQNILSWITTTGASMVTGLREFWLPMFSIWIRESIENLGETLGQILIFVRDWIVITGQWLGSHIAASWSFFWTWWTEQGGAQKTGEWLQSIVDLISGWIVTTATFLYENFVENWLPAFVNWLTEEGGLSMILTRLTEFVGMIAGWIVTVGAPWLVDKLLLWATAFVSWLGPAMGWVIINLGKLIGAMVRWIVGTGVPMLIGAVIWLGKALVDWISGGEESADAQVPSRLGTFLQTLVDFFTVHIIPAIVTAGGEILKGLWQGFVDMSTLITATETGKAIEDFLVGVQAKILDVRQAGLDFCKDFIDGISSGFETYVDEPAEKFRKWLLGLVGQGEKEIEANSPSEVTKRQIGEPMAQGIIEGIKTLTESDVFKTVRNLAVKGLAAFREDGTDEVDGFSGGTLKIMDDLYKLTVSSTEAFAGTMTTAYTTFLTGLNTLLTQFSAMSTLAWGGIRDNAVLTVTGMTTTILSNLGLFSLSLTTAMSGIKNVIVSSFTAANTESVTEVRKLTSLILGVLVGKGETDQTSITSQIKNAMLAAGKLVGQAFVAGIIYVFTEDEMLTPLWTAIDGLVDGIMGRFEMKLASNDLQGMSGNNGITSQFNSRPGTFMPSNVTNISRNQAMTLNVTSNATSQGIINDFNVMRVMNG